MIWAIEYDIQTSNHVEDNALEQICCLSIVNHRDIEKINQG